MQIGRIRPSIFVLKFALPLLVFGLVPRAAHGDTSYLSYTGTLSSPESFFDVTFSLTTSDTVHFQTWGFGGGTNAAGQTIPAGGFDPLIALFTGPAATAMIYTDSSGNPLADADNLLNPPWSEIGNCPPAGLVAIGGNNGCGDDFMKVTLAAGTYTLVLSDANFIPGAVFDNGSLSEGFVDLTDQVFQTCDSGGVCISPNGNFAVDVVSTQADLVSTPEPDAVLLLAIALTGLAGFMHLRRQRIKQQIEGAPK